MIAIGMQLVVDRLVDARPLPAQIARRRRDRRCHRIRATELSLSIAATSACRATQQLAQQLQRCDRDCCSASLGLAQLSISHADRCRSAAARTSSSARPASSWEISIASRQHGDRSSSKSSCLAHAQPPARSSVEPVAEPPPSGICLRIRNASSRNAMAARRDSAAAIGSSDRFQQPRARLPVARRDRLECCAPAWSSSSRAVISRPTVP